MRQVEMSESKLTSDRQAISRWVHLGLDDSLAAVLFPTDSQATCIGSKAWKMMPSNLY